MTMMSSTDYAGSGHRTQTLPKGASAAFWSFATLVVLAPLSLIGLSFITGGKAVASLMFFLIANALVAVPPILAAILALSAAAIAMKQIVFLFKSEREISRPASAIRGPLFEAR